jgi:hypothetical protein
VSEREMREMLLAPPTALIRKGICWSLLLVLLAGSLLGCGKEPERVRTTEPLPPHRIPKK